MARAKRLGRKSAPAPPGRKSRRHQSTQTIHPLDAQTGRPGNALPLSMEQVHHNGTTFYQVEDAKRYYVSECGAILSLVRPETPRLMRPQDNGRGYLIVPMRIDAEGPRTRLVHRVVALRFLPLPFGQAAASLTVNHKDGNKRNNHRDNLAWMTMRENAQHAVANGLRAERGPYYETPAGIFTSSRQAGRANGVSRETVERRCKSGRHIEQGWDSLPRLGQPFTLAPIDVLRAAVQSEALHLPNGLLWADADQLIEDGEAPCYWCRYHRLGGQREIHTQPAATVGEVWRRFRKAIAALPAQPAPENEQAAA